MSDAPRSLLPLAAVALAGCAPVVLKGTSVGNPGLTAARVAEADGLSLQSARLDVGGLVGLGCDGRASVLLAGVTLDLLGPAFVQLPDAPLCGLRLEPAAPLAVEGVDAGGAAFLVNLELPPVQLDGALGGTAGEASVLELGAPGWLSAATLADGYVITPIDPRHALLVDTVSRGSAVYPDPDGDGAVSAEERATPLAAAPADDGDADDDDDDDDDPDDDIDDDDADGDLDD